MTTTISTSNIPDVDLGTIVIKVGSSTIVDQETGFLALKNLSSIVETCCALQRKGYKCILVSSGAVAVGMRRMGLKEKPTVMADKQAAAAIGQGRLISTYDDLFAAMDQPVAQVLLTRTDLSVRSRYLNAKATFKSLLEMGVIPIVNENDVVSVMKIRFGDNDTLGGLVAGLVQASWLFLLTDVSGLYTANPRIDPDATPIHIVEDLSTLMVSTEGTGSAVGTGGMETKLVAARLATAAGCKTAITLGTKTELIARILEGEKVGTVFLAQTEDEDDNQGQRKKDRKWWIRYTLKTHGTIFVDDGALKALLERKSLFSAGITKVEGQFSSQGAVEIADKDGVVFARGIVNYSNTEVDLIKGKRSEQIYKLLGYMDAEEVIHRDLLVLLNEGGTTPRDDSSNNSN